MLDIYTLLSGIIEPITTCYVGHYPTELPKVYPYAEIKFPNSVINNTFSDNNLLQIDIWHNLDTDIREIEGITDLIHTALNRLQHNDVKMNVSINRNNPYRLELPDPIIGVQRRQLRYILTVYYK